MKNRYVVIITILVLAVIPLAYLARVYSSLPESIAIHYNISGKADRFGHKSDAWGISGVLSGVSVLVCLMVLFISYVDPKQAASVSPATFRKIALVVAVFMSILNCYLVYALKLTQLPVTGIYIIICLFLTLLGNFMNNVKPNYFVGIRTPWTLENENNWRKTHHLAGKLWFAGGIIMALLLLLLPVKIAGVVFIGGVILLSLVPVVYSFVLFKNYKKSN